MYKRQQTKSTASDKVIYNQKDLQNPQKLEISEDGTVEMEIKSMTEPDNILPVSYTHLYKLDFINDMADSIGKSIQTLAGVTQNGFSSTGFYVGFLLSLIHI